MWLPALFHEEPNNACHDQCRPSVNHKSMNHDIMMLISSQTSNIS
jgi:hypothetical protein